MIKVIVYLTHDNTFSLGLFRNTVAVDLVATGVSRVVISSEDLQIDSDEDAAAFDYSTEGAAGTIIFDFADLAGLTVGTHLCSLTVYDTLHPNGQVWDNVFRLRIKAQVVT